MYQTRFCKKISALSPCLRRRTQATSRERGGGGLAGLEVGSTDDLLYSGIYLSPPLREQDADAGIGARAPGGGALTAGPYQSFLDPGMKYKMWPPHLEIQIHKVIHK